MAVRQPAPRRPAAPRPAPRRQGFFWSRLHFLIRFLGLTGLVVGCVGLVLSGLSGLLASWDTARDAAVSAVETREAPLSTWLVLGGAAAVAFALLVEVLVVLRFAAGRRSVFGLNAVVQAALAAILFVGINVWSFQHFFKADWTRSRQFTLPANVQKDLEQLDPNADVTVVVYQRHKTFGGLTDKPDRLDYAAERKVVEKVKDLVEQFRDLGKRFHVEVLDVEEESFDDKLKRVTQGAPELAKAIDQAPENCIFVYAGGKAQQMSFNEFFQLDRQASTDANGKPVNLVLLAQGVPTPGAEFSGRGVEPFARKVLNLDERKPRVGVLVVHELLTTEGAEDAFTMSGLRKALVANGFEVRDVVLKRGWEGRTGLEPAADTFEESKLVRLETALQRYETALKIIEGSIRNLKALVDEWSLQPGEKEEEKLDQLSKKYARQLDGRRVTAGVRARQVAVFESELAAQREDLADATRERDSRREDRDKLNVDALQEARRMTDVKAKLDRAVADCDLLLIPRLTRRANGSLIRPALHRFSDTQTAAVKEFLAAGKPVLACVGPGNKPPPSPFEPPDPPDAGGPDLEDLLGELGVRLGKQTVLFPADARAFDDRNVNPLRIEDAVKVPSLDFDSTAALTRGLWGKSSADEAKLSPNRLRQGLRVTAHSVGNGFDVRMRFPRPVYFEPPKGKEPKADPVFLVTASGWNDEEPFATEKRTPHYEPPKSDDKDNNTLDEKRRGAFPVGIAVETPLPAGWSSDPNQQVRLAVIGQGDVFVGSELSPAKERLFLQTANWLLGRDDYLPRADHPWSYPRVDLAPGSVDEQLWLWGTRLGLPVLCAWLGLVVLWWRRLR